MTRQIQRDLFGESISGGALGAPKAGESLGSGLSDDEILRGLGIKLNSLSRQMKELAAGLETVERRLESLSTSTNSRFERVQGSQGRMEEAVKRVVQEFSEKFSTVLSRLTERKGSDAKMEELVNRHNQIVQGFEVKLNQMQKVIGEQELKLLSYQSTLKDLRK